MSARVAVCGFLFAVAIGGAACTPRARLDPRPDMEAAADLARADALVRRGCYSCLQEALAICERVAATGRAPLAGPRAVEVALLLALRERELGLGSGQSFERAVELAGRQPPPFDISVFLSVAEVQGWHQYGVSKERLDEQMRPVRRMFSSWQAWRAHLLAGAGSDVLRDYYLLSLDCTARSFLRDAGLEPWKPPAGAPSILKYRAAICPVAAEIAPLGDLLEADPRWVEAHYFLGELAYGAGTLRTAERHLVEAADGVPGLVAASLTLGHVYLLMEDTEAALEAYHRVNAGVSGQREAMLGEAKCLSYLGRHDDAIAILDDMERLGYWYMGEMHYWRAWNRHRLKRYDAANDDVLDSRKRLPMDPQVDKLAGFIALARNEVPRAETEFRAAVVHLEARKDRDCDAAYYLGSTQVMQRKWADAAPNFERSEPCFAQDQVGLSKRIDMIRASDLPEARKTKLIAAKEREIAAARLQEARSCYNAAVSRANLGDTAGARPFAERAATHPDMKSLATQLLGRLGPS